MPSLSVINNTARPIKLIKYAIRGEITKIIVTDVKGDVLHGPDGQNAAGVKRHSDLAAVGESDGELLSDVEIEAVIYLAPRGK